MAEGRPVGNSSYPTLDGFFSLSHAQVLFKKGRKKKGQGVPVVAQCLTNPTRNHEVVGSIPRLAQWVKDLVLQ